MNQHPTKWCEIYSGKKKHLAEMKRLYIRETVFKGRYQVAGRNYKQRFAAWGWVCPTCGKVEKEEKEVANSGNQT